MGDLKAPLLGRDRERPSLLVIDPKKRALGVRSWIRIDTAGNSHVLEADKFTVMRRCQLPGRDLRLLDPLFVYPSTILGREKAIVVNLEQIRCVITADEVLVLNSLDSYVLQFVSELRRRIAPNKHINAGTFEWRSPGSKKIDVSSYDFKEPNSSSPQANHHEELLDGLSVNALPFELKALEVALETACVVLDAQTAELEDEAYPLLEKLASRISTLNLERVRRLKSRLVGLKRRVERVRDEIEQLMDDDEDMAELYLTKKKEAGNVFAVMSASAPVSPVGSPQAARTLEKLQSIGKHKLDRMNSESNAEGVDEVEMLLEAYFVVVDGILNKLTSLEEYIEDTEDLININLDHVRNQLIQFELILTTATFVMAFYSIIAGIFGMNIPLPLTDRPWAFKWIITVSGLVGVFFFASVILFLRWRKLIPI
ncbi:magnesium transporter MRS2-1 [Selaginella moellendorffii]|uniref:magnesium transporter MRS2-1 n=1 Tax=Selaginella moellendorffii TaxID=88036 RepID=UPI000D1C3B06|nr:magnesium transporter MRS2-1 [Selaginella moellendorffii]XP_024537863.1 magnesium transporter MRS2-1 [Selaginella moellendorffii]|eukprot:XP_024525191.1 magnesium transporter MRS2-1 [Selaginella moellendorffii]